MEALLFFLVFFFPAYLKQSLQFDIGLMFHPEYHLNTLIYTLPQMCLMLYVLQLRSPGGLGDFGIGNIGISLFIPVLLTYLLIFGVSTALGIFAELISMVSEINFYNPALPESLPEGFSPLRPPFLPLLILLTSLVIAYFEELFFRVYLIGQFAETSRENHLVVLLSSLVFAGGHLYQGLIGGLGTFLIGLLLGYRYLHSRNWHEVSIAHALYNFTIILLIPLRL